jgi:hypothetical protein
VQKVEHFAALPWKEAGAFMEALADQNGMGTASVGDASAQAAAAAEQAKRTTEETGHTAAELYFDDVATRNPVRWDEPAISKATDVQLDISLMRHADTSPEGDAARAKVAEALVAAGAGQTLAKKLFADAGRAAKDGYKAPTRESGEAELKAAWGASYDAKIAGAQGLIQKAAAKDPSIIEFLERTGLGNDPAFIRKIANRAAVMSGQPRWLSPPWLSQLGPRSPRYHREASTA